MIPIRIMLALGLVLASASPATALDCETPAMTARYFGTAKPGSRLVLIKGPRTQRFLDAFNAFPPATGYSGDAVVIIRLPQAAERVYLGIYDDGCLKHKGSISRALADKLLEQSNPARPQGQGV